MKDVCHMLVSGVNSEQFKSTLSLKVNCSFLNIWTSPSSETSSLTAPVRFQF